jgi:hypothetical protein
MKKILLVVTTSLILILPSCKKKFLDLFPADQVPNDQAIVDEAGMQAAVNGLYSALRGSNLYGRSIPFYGDILADNTFISSTNSNRYLAEFNYTYISTNANSLGTWGSAYTAILRANNIINANIPATPNSSQLKGEALMMRALMYLNLLNYFAKPFTVDANSEGVPLILSSDPFAKPSRAKVSAVYAQIDKDLSDAFGLMTVAEKLIICDKICCTCITGKSGIV